MRMFTYDKSLKSLDAKMGGMMQPYPMDGVHIAVVAEVGEPKANKSGKMSIKVRFDIVNSDASMPLYINTAIDGSWENSWQGIDRWNQLCEALNIAEGDFQDSFLIGCTLMIEVITKNEYKNIKKMWACTEAQQEKAVQWMSKRGV
jgi:hypothetical protein